MARELIVLMIISKEDDREDIEKPSTIQNIDISKSDFYEEGKSFISLVDVDMNFYRNKMDNRTVKKTLTISKRLNQLGETKGINFLRILTERLEEILEG